MALSAIQFLCAVAVIVIAAVLAFIFSKGQRDSAYIFLDGRARSNRRISSSKTPPRSVSPEKKVSPSTPQSVDYKDTYPPDRREVLARVFESLPGDQKDKLQRYDINEVEFQKNVIPFTADYRDCGPSLYTPTKISIGEIKALGDFPDYSVLTDVPLPEAYTGFQIDTALPRPYRPLRWAYHQTMCKSHRVYATVY
jgi:hypothetical protein